MFLFEKNETFRLKNSFGMLIVITFFLLLCIFQNLSHAQKIPSQDGEIHLGVASCAGSTCHGALAPLPGSNVLQNEYITWEEKDKHSRAYKVLFNDRSKRIAKNLGIKEAHKSALCLNCHADNVDKSKRHSTFKISDGVTCESCHGGSGRWIGTHITPLATHKNNIANGLYPTADPVSRAKMCLSCHFGNETKFVSHRIMGAGHPRMSFELDTFTAIEPAHFVIDNDYKKRGKINAGSVKTWAIGQVIAINLMLDLLSDPSRNMDGFFPELIVFDCHGCHSPMSKLQWSKREGTGSLGPGIPRFNDSNLLMLMVITSQIDKKLSEKLKMQLVNLHESMRKDRNSMIKSALELKNTTNQLISTFNQYNFQVKDMKDMLNNIVENAINGNYIDYPVAEQASMAIGSIIKGMSDLGAIEKKKIKNINIQLEKVYVTVDNSDKFEPNVFITSLKNFKKFIN